MSLIDEGSFTTADIILSSVLEFLRHSDLVAQEPMLAAYQARCDARPASLQAHHAIFES
jgi:glutathione S-transferase